MIDYIYWVELSGFHLKTEIKPSFRNVVFCIKDRRWKMSGIVIVMLVYH
jgi:hypothetical protein